MIDQINEKTIEKIKRMRKLKKQLPMKKAFKAAFIKIFLRQTFLSIYLSMLGVVADPVALAKYRL